MNVLIIGLGSIAKKHVNALRELYGVKSKIIALRSSMSGSSVDGVQDIHNLSQLNLNVDFVLISSPTFNHVKDIKLVLDLNKPLFIEKPLSSSLKGLTELGKLLEKKKVDSYIACNMRFHDCNTFVKGWIEELIKDGSKIEEVNVYCGSYLPDWRPGVDFRLSYSADEEKGGGVHLDVIHELDYLFWFFGKPTKANSYFKSNSELEISSVDYAHYVLEYNKFVATITLNYYRKKPKRVYEIITCNGVLSVDLIEGKVGFNDEVIFECDNGELIQTYKKQIQYFVDNVVESKQSYMNSFNESIEVLSLCLNSKKGV